MLSFVLGLGLYGSVYLLAIFLGLVRDHSPLEIGKIMIVSGAAQLLTAPVAAWLETRTNPRLLTAIGYGLFAAGLLANGFESVTTDFDGLFWPQVLRGASVMLCILPATRLALDTLVPRRGGRRQRALQPDAQSGRRHRHRAGRHDSGSAHAGACRRARQAACRRAMPMRRASSVCRREFFHGHDMGPVNETMRAIAEPLVRKAALVQSFNEAWLVIGALFALSLLVLPFMRRIPQSPMGPATGSDASARIQECASSTCTTSVRSTWNAAAQMPEIELPVAQELLVMAQRQDLVLARAHRRRPFAQRLGIVVAEGECAGDLQSGLLRFLA